jgi:hypothetical protein
MRIELTRISFEVYNVRKAVAAVLHGPDLFDPNDRENKARLPNFEIITGKSPAGRMHNRKAILRVGSNLGRRLLKWSRDSSDHKIKVKGHPRKYKLSWFLRELQKSSLVYGIGHRTLLAQGGPSRSSMNEISCPTPRRTYT